LRTKATEFVCFAGEEMEAKMNNREEWAQGVWKSAFIEERGAK
jgi:hypothetical protein